MDNRLQKTSKIGKEKDKIQKNQRTVSIFHQNVQSVRNKVLELNMIIQTELNEVDVLCLSEHWQKKDYIQLINFNDFNLSSNFSRNKSTHGGTCIYVRYYLQTKEMNYIQGISEEKVFEVSAVEIVEYNLVVVCVYRSPDGDFAIFLQKLETVIKKIIVRKKQIILCGDWNINFMQESKKLRDLQEILLLYNLVNTVTSPTRVTKNSTSLIDVIITNKEITRDTATVIDLGYSDHMAQVLKLPIKRMLHRWNIIASRKYSDKNVEEFKYMLSKETWQEVYLTSDVDSALQIFRDNFDYYFNTAFPYKLHKHKNTQDNNWITKGLKNSGKRLRFLNSLKRRVNLSRESLSYIKKYQTIYRIVLKEAK